MSDTPRTDEESDWVNADGGERFKAVDADFARQLERELAAAVKRADRAKRERDGLDYENALLTSKLITCGVIADHPDTDLGNRPPYSTEWNSQQAERVRGLRRLSEQRKAEIERLQSELNAHKGGA